MSYHIISYHIVSTLFISTQLKWKGRIPEVIPIEGVCPQHGQTTTPGTPSPIRKELSVPEEVQMTRDVWAIFFIFCKHKAIAYIDDAWNATSRLIRINIPFRKGWQEFSTNPSGKVVTCSNEGSMCQMWMKRRWITWYSSFVSFSYIRILHITALSYFRRYREPCQLQAGAGCHYWRRASILTKGNLKFWRWRPSCAFLQQTVGSCCWDLPGSTFA